MAHALAAPYAAPRALPYIPIGVLALALTGSAPAAAQSGSSAHSTPPPVGRAVERAGPVTVDGRLDEPAWGAAEPLSGFTQIDPHEGRPATQRTEVRILYDEEALYLGARMYDSLGARGVRTRLVRRDEESEGDYIEFVLDTYHDHLGRTVFSLNPSGVKGDAGLATPFADPAWDPVWEGAAAIDSLGWTAELRIPFSQLRYSRAPVQTWGLQVWRLVQRLNELSMWSPWGKQEAGGPSRFGHVEGIRAARGVRRAELLPYAVARSAHVGTDPDDPFADPSEMDYRAGADLKYQLSSNFTLDATINPDFGQVEVDPAVVNLTQFETFFPERRPFFIEGAGIFSFGSLSCFFCSNVSSLSLFYSRRIGRPPQLGGTNGDADESFADVPETATILGAAKITGRTAGGWSVGVLDALTRREVADALDVLGTDSVRLEREVEPLTNYFVGRVKRDLRGGDLVVGGIATSVLRRLGDRRAETQLARHSEALGVDWNFTWDKKTYGFMGQLAASNLSGDTAAVRIAQSASARYFHRPDREHGRNRLFSDAYDPTATWLRGYGGYARLAKDNGGWLWEGSANFRSPGFEANDIAFLTRADYVWMSANLARNLTKPTRYYRSMFLIAGAQQQYNYDGDLTDRQLHAFAFGEAPNYWSGDAFIIYRPETYEDRLTRGGPVVRRATNTTVFASLSTDRRKTVTLGTNASYGWNVEGSRGYSYGLNVRVKPASNVLLSVGPSFSRSASTAQYVTVRDDATNTAFYGKRYVFADLAQRSLSMDTRLNVTFTPTLSLQLYLQPLLSSVDYANFKEFDRPRALRKSVFGVDRGSISASPDAAGRDSLYTVDPDLGGPAPAFTFGNPDFNFRSLRGNGVLRWEYRPGSTLYFVWTQSRDHTAGRLGDFDFTRDQDALFSTHPDNIFLVKATYWLGF